MSKNLKYSLMVVMGVILSIILITKQQELDSPSLLFGYLLGMYVTTGIMMQLKNGGKKL